MQNTGTRMTQIEQIFIDLNLIKDKNPTYFYKKLCLKLDKQGFILRSRIKNPLSSIQPPAFAGRAVSSVGQKYLCPHRRLLSIAHNKTMKIK